MNQGRRAEQGLIVRVGKRVLPRAVRRLLVRMFYGMLTKWRFGAWRRLTGREVLLRAGKRVLPRAVRRLLVQMFSGMLRRWRYGPERGKDSPRLKSVRKFWTSLIRQVLVTLAEAQSRFEISAHASDSVALKIGRQVLRPATSLAGRGYVRYLTRLDDCLWRVGGKLPPRDRRIFGIGTLGPGGTEGQLVGILREFRDRGIDGLSVVVENLSSSNADHHLLAVSEMVDEVFEYQDFNREMHNDRVRIPLPRRRQCRPRTFWRVNAQFRYLRDRRPQTVYSFLDSTNVSLGVAAVLARVPEVVLAVRSQAPIAFPFHEWQMRSTYLWLLSKPNVRIFGNSAFVARSYEQWLGLPEGTIPVIYNGVTNVPPDAIRIRDRSGTLQPVGMDHVCGIFRMSAEKRPLLWLKVAAEINARFEKVHFTLVGDGPLSDDVDREIRRLGLEDAVTRIKVERSVSELLDRVDLLLHTSLSEGFPNVVIEAQSRGVPVVQTISGGSSEALIDGESGLTVRDDDPRSISAAVLELLNDPDRRLSMGRNGQNWVRESLTFPRVVEELVGLSKSMTADRTPRVDEMERDRFEFGANWLEFTLKDVDSQRVRRSALRLKEFGGLQEVEGGSFLDVGCGSGLHSLAALDSGMNRVVSFDFDQDSVHSTLMLRERRSQEVEWQVLRGSVLDDRFMDDLGMFDYVYSWGVLHHTGDMWIGLKNCLDRVADQGRFYLALYAANAPFEPISPLGWIDIKRRYLAASPPVRRAYEMWYVWAFVMGRKIWRLGEVRRMMSQERERGMSWLTDIRDWLGGWPMEFAWDEDVVGYCEERGFSLVRMKTGEACSEYLFQRNS